ncbi:DUF6434 domain-containing protein [Algoriphagus namhaensis]
MSTSKTENRPKFSEMKTGQEFKSWYWLKSELVDICKKLGLSYTGGKFELRDRIAHELDHPGTPFPKKPKKATTSKFNWAREKLTLETVLTDNVSFGPNFRNFMKSQVGDHFYCHSDFMDWANLNPGKTLADAVDEWNKLEKRKEDPNFKRVIRPHNMFNQYLRDFFEATEGLKLKDAKKCWAAKKRQKSADGVVRFEKGDLEFLK